MKRLLMASVVAVGAASVASTVLAADPPSWPPGKAQVFVSADTATATSSSGNVPDRPGKLENFFPRTAGVLFRMYAIDLKTKKILTGADVKYAYVTIPGQPNLKLAYGKVGTGAEAPELWTGVWTIPADYPLGVVKFRILVKTNAKRYGSFEQTPVSAARLTVLKAP
jgi:hypothetical protein